MLRQLFFFILIISTGIQTSQSAKQSEATILLQGYIAPLKRTQKNHENIRKWNMGKGDVVGQYDQDDRLQVFYLPAITYLNVMITLARRQGVVLDGATFSYEQESNGECRHVFKRRAE